MVLPTAISFVCGVILRLALFRSSLPDWLSTKTEVVTPLTSWGRGKYNIPFNLAIDPS